MVPAVFCIRKLVGKPTSGLVDGSYVLLGNLRGRRKTRLRGLCTAGTASPFSNAWAFAGQPAKTCSRLWILTLEASHTPPVNASALKLSQSWVKSSLLLAVPHTSQMIILYPAPFIHSCSTLNLLPSDLRSDWWGSSDLISEGAACAVGGEMGTGWAFSWAPYQETMPTKGLWLGGKRK